MNIKHNVNGVTLTNDKGESFYITYSEYWQICRDGNKKDTTGEVKEYISECDEIAGWSADDILADDNLVAQIVDAVISERIMSENGDQIYEEAVRIIRNL